VHVVNIDRCRLRRKSWKYPGRIFANNSAALDEGIGSPICSDLMFEVLDGRLLSLDKSVVTGDLLFVCEMT